MTRADFDFGAFSARVSGWLAELQTGRGFVLIRGVPVGDFSERERELLYWGLGLYLGRAIPQNTFGDVLGHVRDTGEDPEARGVGLYRTRAD